MRVRFLLGAILLGAMALLAHFGVMQAWPAGSHCIGVGPGEPLQADPTDPAFCGCTWGAVLYRGVPVTGAQVTLSVMTGTVTSTTAALGREAFAYYSLTGKALGASRSDVMTLTATYAGLTVARSFRAWPAPDGEQRVDLVLPHDGEWQPLTAAGYTATVALAGNTLWAGGPAGVLRVDTVTGSAMPLTTPLPAAVSTLLLDDQARLWAAGGSGVARYEGASWARLPDPFSGKVRAFAYDPASGDLWAGGGTTAGVVARYHAGAWETLPMTPTAPVVAMAIDGQGGLWLSSWGNGLARWDGTGWATWRARDGLFSDTIYAIQAGGSLAPDVVWFGGRSHFGDGVPGSVARYDLATGQWQVEGISAGLPADALVANGSAAIYALAQDSQGLLWAGTERGVYVRGAPSRWTAVHGDEDAPVSALAAAGGAVAVSRPTGAGLLARGQAPGLAPVVTLTRSMVTAIATVPLEVMGAAFDRDEAEAHIAAWAWTFDEGSPLCTSAGHCLLPAGFVAPGLRTIRVRVQDDEGMWSDAAEWPVSFHASALYLPLAAR